MQRRMAFRAETSSSRRSRSPNPPQDEENEENVIYSYAPKVVYTLDASKLNTLVGRYQIPIEFRPRLPKGGNGVVLLFQALVYIHFLPVSRS